MSISIMSISEYYMARLTIALYSSVNRTSSPIFRKYIPKYL